MIVIDLDDDKTAKGKAKPKAVYEIFLKDILAKKPFVLFVHASWCSHCTHVKPMIEAAVEQLNSSKKSGREMYALVKVSDDVARHMQTKHSNHLFSQLLNDTVQGYPTIVAVDKVKGNEMRVKFFNKERTTDNFKKFFTRRE